MKRLVTICAVLGLILVPACVSRASLVTPPPGAPGWWNSETGLYAYGWWSSDIISGGIFISPPNNASHWASNYLVNTNFEAQIVEDTIHVDLGNVSYQDRQKRIYVYITGTAASNVNPLNTNLDTDGGTFYGGSTWNINQDHQWNYVLSGVIIPQPEFVNMSFDVPGMTGVTNIWAGENCAPVPLPAAFLLGLLGMGAAGLKLRRFA